MNPRTILIWINCYGAWDPLLRDPAETIGYNEYLNGVADAVAALKDRVAAIHVSGGMYDQNGRTECATTIPELEKRLRQRGMAVPEITADEQSVTSITIARTFLTVWQERYTDYLPILFTDEARFATNAYVLEQLSGEMGIVLPPVREVLVPIRRTDTHPNSGPERQAEKLRLMQEKGINEVERMEMDARKEHLKKH